MRVWTRLGSLTVAIVVAGAVSQTTPDAQGRQTTLAATSGADLRSWDSAVDQMTRAGGLQVRRTDADPLLPRRSHERLDQFYKGVRVYGADIARQLESGSTVSVFGTMYQDIELDVTPTLSVADAAAVVSRESGVTLGEARQPELLILPQHGDYRLVYHAYAFTGAGAYEYFIDARTGDVVLTLDAAQRQSAIGSGTGVLNDNKKMSVTPITGGFQAADALRPPFIGTYDMKENLNRTMDILNGVAPLLASDRAFDADNSWTDRATVDAHSYAGYVYDYYYKRFGRRGLDNNNVALISFVHPVPRSGALTASSSILGSFYVNAFYFHGGRVMVYGEGLPGNVTLGGQNWNYLSGGLDVVGHELTHGVTAFSSGLIYQGESGALNESFSDMMGTAVEFYFQAAGSGPRLADYVCAEDVVTPGGIRSLENPGAYGDPDHYSRRYIGTADNGGVHTNSGIGNQWYYLAIEGGTNRTSGIAVTGVGRSSRDQIEKIAYRAFTQLMTSNATYASARLATIQAARDLYGANSNAERAITQAWTAVGVN